MKRCKVLLGVLVLASLPLCEVEAQFVPTGPAQPANGPYMNPRAARAYQNARYRRHHRRRNPRVRNMMMYGTLPF